MALNLQPAIPIADASLCRPVSKMQEYLYYALCAPVEMTKLGWRGCGQFLHVKGRHDEHA